MIGLKINIGSLPGSIILFCVALAALVGCAMPNYGKLESSPDITRAFQAYKILPDHAYYYLGTFSSPSVIAGINKSFDLNSKLWVKIDTQSKDFYTLIDRVALRGYSRAKLPSGFTILDHSGRNVGVWYSARGGAVVEVKENGKIVKLSPLRTKTGGSR